MSLYTGSVLCPGLYNTLQSRCPGGVKIANQGEPQQRHQVRGYDGRMREQVISAGEYYRVNCPYCRDTKHRLWVNHMYGQPGTDGYPMRFLAVCFNERCLENSEHSRHFYDLICGFRNSGQRHQTFQVAQPDWDESPVLEEAQWPGTVYSVADIAASAPNHPAVTYMMGQRGYSLSRLMEYQVGFCDRAIPKYIAAQQRIIFPIYFEGKFVGWQGRILPGHVGEKYYTMPGLKKGRMLYNYDKAKTNPWVVIVEGVTDVHALGNCAVALLGSSMTYYQRSILINTWHRKPIILALDPDALEGMRELATWLREQGQIVIELELPQKVDMGSLERTVAREWVYQTAARFGVELTRVAA